MQRVLNATLLRKMAHLAGYDFSLDRCRLLVPQAQWLLGETGKIRALALQGEEPILVFRPAESVPPWVAPDEATT